MKARAFCLASAAAALFIAGVAGPALAQGDSEAKIKCEGVNECKGHGACAGANHACAGKNSCKGKGFEMMTPEECEAAKQAAPKQ